MRSGSLASIIALAGLVAGRLDILYAFVLWFALRRVSPVRILQSVARGLLVRDSQVR